MTAPDDRRGVPSATPGMEVREEPRVHVLPVGRGLRERSDPGTDQSGIQDLVLLEEHGMYRQLFDTIDRGFCIIRVIFEEGRPTDYVFLRVNAAFEQQTGLKDAVGRSMRSLRPDHEDYWFETYGAVAASGESVEFENEARALDRWYDVHAFRIGRPSQRLVAILFNDITERKRAQRERDALQARLESDLTAMRRLVLLSRRLVKAKSEEAILDEILEATMELQRADRGNVQLYDPETETLRIAVQRGFEAPFLEHFASVRAEDESACGRALRRRTRVVIQDVEEDAAFAPHLPAAREAGYRAVYSTPILDPAGEPIGVLSTHFRQPHAPGASEVHLTDLYLRLVGELLVRRKEQALLRSSLDAAEKANAAKSQFLSSVSHELRTPLTAVIGMADLLEGEIHGDLVPRQKTFVQRIKASAWHLVAIIDEIMSYTRSEMGNEEVRLASVDVAAIATDVVEMLAAEAAARGIELRLHVGGTAPAVTDGGKVRQILVNLVGNALRYTDEGSVDVHLEASAGRVTVRVRDTGRGIPADRLDDIFDPFVQVDGSPTREVGGTGLGLAIARRLAHLLGGDVRVRSEVGVGSEFELVLPTTTES